MLCVHFSIIWSGLISDRMVLLTCGKIQCSCKHKTMHILVVEHSCDPHIMKYIYIGYIKDNDERIYVMEVHLCVYIWMRNRYGVWRFITTSDLIVACLWFKCARRMCVGIFGAVRFAYAFSAVWVVLNISRLHRI